MAFLCGPVRQQVERQRRERGRAIRPSSTSTTGPIGRKTSSRRTGSSSPTSAPASSRTLRGSRPSATTPITSTARWLRAVVGLRARQHGRQKQVLGLDGDLHPVGRLGRPLRSRGAGVQGSRRPRLPRSAARDLAVRKQDHVSHVQYETASVLRFAEDLYGLGQLAAADDRANSPAGDCFDFSQKPASSCRSRRPCRRSSSCVSTPTMI